MNGFCYYIGTNCEQNPNSVLHPLSPNFELLELLRVICVTCFFCIIVSEYIIFYWFDHDIKHAIKIVDMNIQHNIVKGVIFYNIF